MSNPIERTDPVPTSPFIAEGVTIALLPPMARYSLRARQAQALETLLKVKIPKKIGASEGGIFCLGPDEWMMRAPQGTKIEHATGVAVSVTNVSERSICLSLQGPHAAAILMSGCPLDLDHFEIGRATRTIYETIEIIVIRESDQTFHVEVWRSFADWLWTALTKTASH
jgi:sarcosine oxidase, subunit gamma